MGQKGYDNMKITEIMNGEGIIIGASPSSKENAFDMLIKLHANQGSVTDEKVFKGDIWKREALGPTAIGDGISIPHAKSSAVKKPMICALTVPKGIDLGALDKNPSKLIFMIAAPEKGGNVHLEILGRLTALLVNSVFRKKLLEAKTPKEFLKIIDEFDEERSETKTNSSDASYRILAVTACPTGIAHTFMAAEALEKAGEKLGIKIKCETNGSGGAKNILTPEEIEKADGIIIAADKKVDMARFNGKKVIQTKVSDGIHKPEELINKIIEGKAPIYTHNGEITASDNSENESIGRRVYKHLMNGVSHMLPFVVGGGILIALAFLFDDYSIDPSSFGSNTPLAAFFKKIGDTSFGFMLPILSGYIAMSIADRPGLAAGITGGALAVSGATFVNAEGGVSAGFLGALFAGFIAGWIVNLIKKAFSFLPKSLEGIKPVLIYPLLGIFLVGVVMSVVNPFIGMLNTALENGLKAMGTSSRVLLGLVLGGMMAIDMGGPFNKAAYVFGTASIAGGNYDIMAAVMVGGMVPPIAIALACTFFKSKFSPRQRQSGYINYILGLCFITEGAIPFAAEDPIKVIPSCIIGSAIAGALSMAFGCTLMAPHGGIFVFPVVGNPIMYVVALLIGSAVGCALLGILKRKIEIE